MRATSEAQHSPQPSSAPRGDATAAKRRCAFQKRLEKLMGENHPRRAAAGEDAGCLGKPSLSAGSTRLLGFRAFFSTAATQGWGGHTPAAFSGRGWDTTLLLRTCFFKGPWHSAEMLREQMARPRQLPKRIRTKCIPK